MLTTGLIGGLALMASAMAGACDGGGPQVEMSIEWEARSIPVTLRHIAREEVAAIWSRLGITVKWVERPATGVFIVRAIVTDEAGQGGAASPPHLGWIEFWGDTPSNELRVSAAAAIEAARAARTQDGGTTGHPLAALHITGARLVGRAIAHELGHFVLRSRRHTSSGLMRAVFPAYEALIPFLDRYRLERRQLAVLQANGRDGGCRQP